MDRKADFDTSTWKALFIGLSTYGLLGVGLSIFPDFSIVPAIASIILGAIGTISLIYGTGRESLAAQIVYIGTVIVLLFSISTRAWIGLVGLPWVWIAFHTILLLLLSFLPALIPKLSNFIVNEQKTPKTTLGQGCISVSVILMPAAAGIGSVIGLYGPRYGLNNLVLLVVAILVSTSASGLGHWFSHHIWEDYLDKKSAA